MDIDTEVRRIVTEGYEKAKTLLTDNMDTMKRIAETLLEVESLNGEQLDALMNGELPQEGKV